MHYWWVFRTERNTSELQNYLGSFYLRKQGMRARARYTRMMPKVIFVELQFEKTILQNKLGM